MRASSGTSVAGFKPGGQTESRDVSSRATSARSAAAKPRGATSEGGVGTAGGPSSAACRSGGSWPSRERHAGRERRLPCANAARIPSRSLQRRGKTNQPRHTKPSTQPNGSVMIRRRQSQSKAGRNTERYRGQGRPPTHAAQPEEGAVGNGHSPPWRTGSY